MSRITAFIILLLLTSSPFTHASIAPNLGSEEYSMRLSELLTSDQVVILRGAQSEFSFDVPVSERVEVLDALLKVHYTNSIALTSRSQLIVQLNSKIVAQVPLRANAPEGRMTVKLPANLLESGYNKLTVAVAQHYTDSCEDPTSPELWTQIDTDASDLTFKVRYKRQPYRLNNLADFIDRKLWPDYQLNIVTASASPSDSTLAASGLIAQGAALLLDYVPLVVTHQIASLQPRAEKTQYHFPKLNWSSLSGRDSVLIGSREELKDIVSGRILTKITGPFLGIYPNEKDPSRFVLVVSGRDEAELHNAAQAFAMRAKELPAVNYVVVDDITIQEKHGYQRQNTLSAGTTYRFSDFGFATQTLKGMYPEPATLRFWVAPGMFSPGNEAVELHLHLAYGAGIDQQSTLNLFLNGVFEHAIHMSEPHGVVYYDYIVKIRVSSLQPGWNEFSFRPSMLPVKRGGACEKIFTDNLLLTLFDDSYLRMEQVANIAKLPDLKLLQRTGFPFSMNNDGVGVSFQVTDTDSSTLAAAWTLLAKLTQIAKQPLLHVQLAHQIHSHDDHLIIIGNEAGMQPDIKQAAPSRLSEMLSTINDNRNTIQFRGQFDDLIAALQFESPFRSERSVLMVMTNSTEILAPGVAQLVQHKLWGQLESGMVLWRPDDKALQHFDSASAFYIGSPGVRSHIGFYFSDNPALALAIILAGIILFVFVSRWLLIRFRRKHHPNVNTNV